MDEAYEQALRAGVWVERAQALRLVRLTGPQRIWFLQNTITADVEDLPSGRWVESCFLDPKGRVQAQFRVGVLDDEVWLDVSPDAGTALVEWFVRYRFRTKVEIEAQERRTFTILGPPASGWAEPGEVKVHREAIAFGDRFGDVPTADVHSAEAPSIDLPKAPADLYDIFRIEAGVGAFGVDYGTRDLPQEAGLTRTVSVSKGCYVGQETVARIHFRGHVNRVLRPLSIEGAEAEDVTANELRLDGAAVGRVTSAVRSPRAGVVGLGMVRVEPPEGTRLEIEAGGVAVVGPLPAGTKIKT